MDASLLALLAYFTFMLLIVATVVVADLRGHRTAQPAGPRCYFDNHAVYVGQHLLNYQECDGPADCKYVYLAKLGEGPKVLEMIVCSAHVESAREFVADLDEVANAAD